jgi:hypothetical protein
MQRIVLLTIAVVLGTAAPAGAQATSTVTPNEAGKASRLQFEVDGLAPPIGGRLPRAMELAAASGFKLNLKALSKRCSEQAAKLNECPRRSLMGKGRLVVEVTTPDAVREALIDINVYLGPRRKILAVAYVFGWQVVPGTLSAANGIVVTFNPLPTGAAFPNVSYRLKRIWFDFGAKRVIKKRRVRLVNGSRRVTIRRRRVNLIRNPATCRGSWASAVSLGFPDGSETALAAPTACSR